VKQNPLHVSFIPFNLPFLPVNKYFITHFLNFFVLEKTSENPFQNFHTRAKMEKWEVEKKHVVGREKF
jgi:hypothetical protein